MLMGEDGRTGQNGWAGKSGWAARMGGETLLRSLGHAKNFFAAFFGARQGISSLLSLGFDRFSLLRTVEHANQFLCCADWDITRNFLGQGISVLLSLGYERKQHRDFSLLRSLSNPLWQGPLGAVGSRARPNRRPAVRHRPAPFGWCWNHPVQHGPAPGPCHPTRLSAWPNRDSW